MSSNFMPLWESPRLNFLKSFKNKVRTQILQHKNRGHSSLDSSIYIWYGNLILVWLQLVQHYCRQKSQVVLDALFFDFLNSLLSY